MADNVAALPGLPTTTERPPGIGGDWWRWLLAQLLIPIVVAVVTGAFSVGGAWAAFGSVSDDVAELKALHGLHEREGHPLIMVEVNANQRQLDRLCRNIGALCRATGAACEF